MSYTEEGFLRGRRGFLASSALLGLTGGLAVSTRAETVPRVALVVGNSRYPGAPLANAVNDAELVASTARNLGFKVSLLLNASSASLLEAVKLWLDGTVQAEARMLYFAGHGAQYRGRNFLIPVDARLHSEDDLPAVAFSVNDLADRLSRFGSGVSVVVLDACRSIPSLTAPPGVRMRGAPETPWTPGLLAASAKEWLVHAPSGEKHGRTGTAYRRCLQADPCRRAPGIRRHPDAVGDQQPRGELLLFPEFNRSLRYRFGLIAKPTPFRRPTVVHWPVAVTPLVMGCAIELGLRSAIERHCR
jgi:hypothetical protein